MVYNGYIAMGSSSIDENANALRVAGRDVGAHHNCVIGLIFATIRRENIRVTY